MSRTKPWVILGFLAGIVFGGGFWLGSSRWFTPAGHLRNDSPAPATVVQQRFQFREVHESLGIDFLHFDSRRASLLPEDVGSGVGWIDYDKDGDDDLYLVNVAGPFLMEPNELSQRSGNRMFRNDQGKFTDVTKESGLGHIGWDYGCLWFDYDNDGWLDVAVTNYVGVLLYRNQGNGRFEDRTQAAGLAGIQRFLLGMTSADFDHDGDLDLYLCGYVTFDREKAKQRPLVAGRPAVWTNPTSYPAERNIMLRNEGNGTFSEVTDQAGVANPQGKSMQAVACDFNNDGWADLYVANDVGTADVLFHNQKDGTFQDVSLEANTSDRRASMGLAVGDVWHRGWLDLFATHWVAEDHAMWKNQTEKFQKTIPIAFDDVAQKSGLTRPKLTAYVGWGTALVDFDNDGELDLIVANGSTIEDELTVDVLTNPKLMPQPVQVFRNTGDGNFVELSTTAGPFFAQKKVYRGLATSDYDQDGRLDVVVATSGDRISVLRNETPQPGHWLQVSLKGTTSNRFGVGATVRVKAGNVIHRRDQVLGTSYLSTNSYRLHFGLGAAPSIDWVEVQWPGGDVSKIEHPEIDRVIEIEE